MTTSGTTTSCSANRVHAHGSDSKTEVSSTYVRTGDCESVTGRSSGSRGPREPLGGHCGTRTGTGPVVVDTRGAARTAEHVASHRKRRYSGLSPRADRRAAVL